MQRHGRACVCACVHTRCAWQHTRGRRRRQNPGHRGPLGPRRTRLGPSRPRRPPAPTHTHLAHIIHQPRLRLVDGDGGGGVPADDLRGAAAEGGGCTTDAPGMAIAPCSKTRAHARHPPPPAGQTLLGHTLTFTTPSCTPVVARWSRMRGVMSKIAMPGLVSTSTSLYAKTGAPPTAGPYAARVRTACRAAPIPRDAWLQRARGAPWRPAACGMAPPCDGWQHQGPCNQIAGSGASAKRWGRQVDSYHLRAVQTFRPTCSARVALTRAV